MRAKQLSGGRRFRPDIIIHRRLSNAENVLVVETKSRAQNSASDERKLSELTAEMSTYRYWAGAFIVFFNQPSTVMQSGVLQVTIDWFSRSEKEERIEIAYPIPNQLLRRVRVFSQADRLAAIFFGRSTSLANSRTIAVICDAFIL
jgi:hypothetical protein